MGKIMITTPIYYVNDEPHIGHAYTTLIADILSRYYRILGDEVLFLTGTDEHGQKMAESARKEGLDPKRFVDIMSEKFQKCWESLDISYDFFIRTTDPRHEEVVSKALLELKNKGYIYEGVYEGLYCLGCEKFLVESDLVDGVCPLHPNLTPLVQKENNYFFKLSAFGDAVSDLIESGKLIVLPEERKAEILGKLRLGLNDVSISRAQVSWGIPVPWDRSQTVYVWVDALFNYYSGALITKGKGFWETSKIIHIIGKDILWFHAVIWPALLLALGVKTPSIIFVHGYFTIGGQKISKTLGNVIKPQDLLNRYHVDASRYLLSTSLPFGKDGNVSFEIFDERYRGELVNGLGNLIQRIYSLVKRTNVFMRGDFSYHLPQEFGKYLEEFNFISASGVLNRLVSDIDRIITDSKPWESEERTLGFLNSIYGSNLREILSMVQVLMPSMGRRLIEAFLGKNQLQFPVFPKID